MAEHHPGCAGSITLRPSTLIAVLRELVESLARHGFERFYFVNGHGGNIATVTTAFSEIYAARSLPAGANVQPVKCRLRNWWQNHEVSQLAKELYGDAEGGHATPSEVAVTQFVYPDAIKSAPLDPPIAPWGELADAANYRRNFPVGRIGSNPGLATPEAGRRLYDAAVAALTVGLPREGSGFDSMRNGIDIQPRHAGGAARLHPWPWSGRFMPKAGPDRPRRQP
jgi:creatinine amidohydrolase